MSIARRPLRGEKPGILALIVAVATAAGMGAQIKSLSLDDAVKAALASDARVESANWDWLAATAKAEEANRRKLPSLSVSAGYTRLSDLTSSISLGSFMPPITLKSLDNVFSLSANLQYPVFAGFRVEETARLAGLQAQGKQVGVEMVKRALVFETRRAYWEAVRSTHNVRMLRENLTLMQHNRDVTERLVNQGTAIRADLLTAEMRCSQAEMDLNDAVTLERRAFGTLGSLVGASEADSTAVAAADDWGPQFALATQPDDLAGASLAAVLKGQDDAALVGAALSKRPETRSSRLAVTAAETGLRLAQAPLYPTLSLTGNYTCADPNSRVAFQTDPYLFTGTWSLGLLLSYDVGGLPANLAERDSQSDALRKSVADERRQQETVRLDVRNCLLAFRQAQRDYALVTGMIGQAQENERVTRQRLSAGTASDLDLLTAQISRLRVEFSIVNKQIDEQIAAADLERATALAAID